MKVQDVILKAMAKKINWLEAAEMRPDRMPDERWLPEVWLRRTDGPAAWKARR